MARKPAGLKEASQPAPEPTVSEKPATAAASKRMFAFRLDPAAFRELRRIAFEEERTFQDLGEEMVNDLLRKRGRPQVARIEGTVRSP